MINKLKSAMAGVATLAIAGGGLIGFAASAHAAGTTPAWEPDPNAAGSLVFYDTSGNVITGGSNFSHLFDYAAGTTAPDSGAIKATMYFAAPDHTKTTSALWFVQQQSASNPFPNSAAPAPITGPGFTNPLDTLGTADANLAAFLGAATFDTTPGWSNIVQVRVKNTGGSSNANHFWESDIAFNNGSSPITVDGLTVAPGTWQQLYPTVATTTTTLTATPPSPQTSPQGATAGQNVTLNATVSPAEGGTVQFFDGTTSLGSPVAVASGAASTVVTAPAFGTHSYTATFVPTGGTEVQGSTSSALSYVVTAPQTATTTSLAGSSTTQQYAAASFTATVTEADAPATAGQAGSVVFTATGGSPSTATTLGTVPTSGGSATLNLSSVTLTPGSYQVTAAFTPTNNTYATSTSSAVSFTVTPTSCKGTPAGNGATCTDVQNIQVTVNPGSLTITTPYTSAKPFVLPAMTLNSAGTLLSTSATFPATGDNPIVVQSSLAGDPNWTVTVSGTDLTSGSNVINGTGLGLTGGTLMPTPVFPGTVAFTNNPAHNPSVTPADGNVGIKGGPFTFAASSGGGNGSAAMYGTLSLNAPTSTPAGTYAGTITFAVS